MPDTRVYLTVKEMIQQKIDAKAALQAKEAALQADKQQTAALPSAQPVQLTESDMVQGNQPSASDASRASAMMNKLRNAESTAGVIEAMKEQEQASAPAASSEQPATNNVSSGNGGSGSDSDKAANGAATSKVVEPKQFPMLHCYMGETDNFTVRMTLPDLVAYGGFEKSLYSTEDGKPLTEKLLKEKSFLERFQRQLDSDRIKDIARYVVGSPRHYVPPIICVPATMELYETLVEAAKQVSGNGGNGSAGSNRTSVELIANSILAIDGQHRLAGIGSAIGTQASVQRNLLVNDLETLRTRPLFKADGETQEQLAGKIRNKERELAEHDSLMERIRSESLPVVIVVLSPDDLEGRQQLFSDINKTPRKVSKAIATLYDHSDVATVLAKYCAGMTTQQFGDGLSGLEGLVNLEGISPKKSESKVCTLTNLTSLIQVDKGTTCLVNAFRDNELNLEEIGKLVSTVVYNLPRIQHVVAGVAKYGEINTDYVCYSSVFWKGMGLVINDLIAEQNRKAPVDRDYSSVIDTVEMLMVHLGQTDGWSVRDELWTDSVIKGKPAPVVNTAGKVDNKITVIRWLRDILMETVTKLRSAN